MYSINDELHDFKQRVAALGLKILQMEKVGNGNMAAYKMCYRVASTGEEREAFFRRHDMDRFGEQLWQEYGKR